MFHERDNFTNVMKEIVDRQISTYKFGLSIWQITDIKNRDNVTGQISQYSANIKHFNFKYTLDDVPFIGLGLGHKKGMIKYPSVGDFVIVAYIDKQPIILGTIYDVFTQSPDSPPLIKLDEMCIVQKENGSIILMKDNNDVMIRAADSTGNFDNGAKIRINNDGSFKVFNKGNFGVECDAAGNLTVYGGTINNLKVAGTTGSGGSPSHTHSVDLNVEPVNPLGVGTW